MKTKVDRYKEREFDVLEAIQNAPERGLYFESLVQLGHEPVKLHKTLKRFIAKNILSERNDHEGAFFFIGESNTPLLVKRVICPICGTVRRTHRDDQQAIHCLNPECKTPSGRHRTFWLINIDHWRKGNVRRINFVN